MLRALARAARRPATLRHSRSLATPAEVEKWVDQEIASDEQSSGKLSPVAHWVMRVGGFEPPFRPYDLYAREWTAVMAGETEAMERLPGIYNESRAGVYSCVNCNTKLFTSEDKLVHGKHGWPVFMKGASKDALNVVPLRTHGLRRDGVCCSGCGGHVGLLVPAEHLNTPTPASEAASTGNKVFLANGSALHFGARKGASLPTASEGANPVFKK